MFTLLNSVLLIVVIFQLVKLRKDVLEIDVPDCRKCNLYKPISKNNK